MKKVILSLMFLVVFVSGCKRDITVSGFMLGQEIDVQDEDIRGKYSLGVPVRVALDDAEYAYDECKVLEVNDDDYDRVTIYVSEGKKEVIGFKCAKDFSKYADALLGLEGMFRAFTDKYKEQVEQVLTSDEMECVCRLKDGSECLWLLKSNSRTVQVFFDSKEFTMMRKLERKNRTDRMNAESLVNSEITDAIETALEELEYYYGEEEDEGGSELNSIKSRLRTKFSEVQTTDKSLKDLMRAVEQFFDDESDSIIRDREELNASQKNNYFQRGKKCEELKKRLNQKIWDLGLEFEFH